jgi:rod shape-determining protein MreC
MPTYIGETPRQNGRRQLILAFAFFGLALVLMYMPPGPQRFVATALRSTLLRPFISTQEVLARARVHASETSRLQVSVDSLSEVLAGQTTLMEENRRLRALLDLSDRLGPSFRPASVIRSGTAGSESMFLLDLGYEDGIRPGAPVVVGAGLVGVVREVQPFSAIGMDWSHPDFRASAMTVDGDTYGIVSPWRGVFREQDRLTMDGTPFYSRLDEGTLVVTSGLGGIFPRGLPIGAIEDLAEADAGWRKSYWVRPAVDPGSVIHALVGVGEGPHMPLDSLGSFPSPEELPPVGEGATGPENRR